MGNIPIEFSNTTPAAPPGSTNVIWQTDSSGNLSAYISSPSGVYLPLTGGTLSGNLTLDAELIDSLGSPGTSGQVLSSTGTGVEWITGGGGGLTSVGLSTTATWLTVGSSPLTSNGTITLNPTTGLTANEFLATPNGSSGAVGLRAIVAADIPSLPYLHLTGGTLTGNLTLDSTLTDGSASVGTSGQVLSSTGSATQWINNPAGFTNPMTTAGDLIYEDSTPAPARLGIGTSGYVLTVVSGLPAWAPASGGGGGGSRTTASISQSIDANAIYQGTVSLAKTFAVLIVDVNVPSRLRLYATSGARDNDASRTPQQPLFSSSQNECICDVILNSTTGLTWVLAPTAYGSDCSGSPTGNIAYNLTNLTNTTQTVTVTLTYLPLET